MQIDRKRAKLRLGGLRSVLILVLGLAAVPGAARSQQTTQTTTRARSLEREAERLIALGFTEHFRQAAYTLGDAGKIWVELGARREAVASFTRAGDTAREAGEMGLALGFFGRAAELKDAAVVGRIRTALVGSPLLEQTRDLLAEVQFIQDTRALLESTGIDGLNELAGDLSSAVDAHEMLEEVAAAGRRVDLRIESAPGRLEVQVRRWVHRFKNGPWETVVADTTLKSKHPVRYEFCYLDPSTRARVIIDQPCADGCSIRLPSAAARPANACGS